MTQSGGSGNASAQNFEDISDNEWPRHRTAGLKASLAPGVCWQKQRLGKGEMERVHPPLCLVPPQGERHTKESHPII